MRLTVIASICLALASRCATSQEVSSQGAFFAWGTINIALAPDTARGLQLFTATTSKAGPSVGQRGLETSFNPDSARAWASRGDSFFDHPPDTGWIVSSSLVDRSGAGMILAQHRDRAGAHVDQYLVLFNAGARNPLRVRLIPNAGPAFLAAVRQQAARAGWSPPPVRSESSAPVDRVDTIPVAQRVDETIPVARPPAFLHGPMLGYPEFLRQEGAEGAVWVRFRVDSTGHPVLATLTVLFSSNVGFTDEVRRWAKYAQFRPAEVYGHPIATMVELPFTFSLH